ncbi:DUF309 domain-containing protein [Alkalicoccus luteus]|uniref:DUF309 domain-containing protein n=1 Tax=Alkalicoccus luteus TaxID=1237094 RepID=UPI0040341A08
MQHVTVDYPQAYVNYLVEFHATRDFFECHEILEEYWIENGREKTWLLLIQLAVGLYHQRRGNLRGSLKLFDKVFKLLDRDEHRLHALGIYEGQLRKALEERYEEAANGWPYQPFAIPLVEQVEHICRQQASEHGLEWNLDDRSIDRSVLHRHLLRDRSEVEAARAEALNKRQQVSLDRSNETK